jgi:hypothetical protein
MDAEDLENSRSHLPRILSIVGFIAMLVGAVDPLEGSLAILPGSGLVALGTYLEHRDRRLLMLRVWALILVVIGVGAMWAFSSAGGIGGNTGLSMWWGLLTIPYLVGWSLGIWGTASPRWVPAVGIVVGLWYIAIGIMVLFRPPAARAMMSDAPAYIIGALGLVTIVGCVWRLKKVNSANRV